MVVLWMIWQIISFILPPSEYGCVYASLSVNAIDLQKMPILLNKIFFSEEAHFDLDTVQLYFTNGLTNIVL